MEKNKNRKLAAILFADIVGYTALMQKDEATANTLLNKFHNTINTKVENHKGQVINNYGDGCVCTFDSAVAAMNCAKDVQIIFQKKPTVPVRIGLHSGDVFFKENNVYGDSVNIASRIESLGVAGAILFSKQIKRHISNQKEFEVQSLGEFDFKSVEKTMEVFALANQGIVIPKREEMKGKLKEKKKNKWLVPLIVGALLLTAFGIWKMNPSQGMKLTGDGFGNHSTPLSKEIRDKRVAVMVFENKTQNEKLEDFGTMISDWITRGLMDIGEADVISAANIQTQINQAGLGNVASPELEKATGVGVTIQGRYYLQEDELIIHADIVNASDGKVIHTLDLIQGKKNQMMQLLDELTQRVLGYWAVKKQKRYLHNPPKYDAWKKLNEGLNLSGYKSYEAIPILWEAYHMDTTFYAPLLKLVNIYSNGQKFEKADSIIDFIHQKNPPLTAWEKNRFESIQAREKGDYLRAAQIAEKRYQMDKSDHTACYNSGILYSRINHLKKALEVWTSFDTRFLNPNSEIAWMPGWIADTYLQLGDYENALKVIEAYNHPKIFITVVDAHLRTLVHQGKFEALQKQLEIYQKSEVYTPVGRISAGYFYEIISNELAVLNEQQQLEKFAKEYKQWILENSNKASQLDKSLAAFHLKDYNHVIELLEKDATYQFRNPGLLSALLGVAYAKIGNKEKVNQQLEKVATMDYSNARFKGCDFYNQAIIETAMGNKEAAVNLLKKAADVGVPFQFSFYHRDGLLKSLKGYPPFEELVKPKG